MSILKPREPKQATAVDQDETTGDFRAYWHEQAYNEIERSDLALIGHIERLVKAGRTPAEIKAERGGVDDMMKRCGWQR